MAKEETFSAEEREAMKSVVRERRSAKKLTPEQQAAEVQAVIDKMPEVDRKVAQRLHDLLLASAPQLKPKTWYGMPAYALGDKVVCFFQNPDKYKVRYFVLGFNDSANLDDGDFWATSFAIKNLTGDVEKRIANLVTKAVSG